ncbi:MULTISPECIES: hypothetical protein [unclassified Marinobacterium]|uniref:hypothetical protein n=1 Tax=unclassified Marinobacterium TaxID=2644139 RepID=UPI001568895C|nr:MULTISPECIES: hypothetical protein [unclassified Marinobacterium]NRP09358.1 hypothetical protein [Marinobacterium sp. xm-g-48]NRP82111.1 hypothetical protein [Marinobacterium sp. xm-d-509]
MKLRILLLALTFLTSLSAWAGKWEFLEQEGNQILMYTDGLGDSVSLICASNAIPFVTITSVDTEFPEEGVTVSWKTNMVIGEPSVWSYLPNDSIASIIVANPNLSRTIIQVSGRSPDVAFAYSGKRFIVSTDGLKEIYPSFKKGCGYSWNTH